MFQTISWHDTSRFFFNFTTFLCYCNIVLKKHLQEKKTVLYFVIEKEKVMTKNKINDNLTKRSRHVNHFFFFEHFLLLFNTITKYMLEESAST